MNLLEKKLISSCAAVHPLYYLLRKAFKNGARLNLKGATKQLRSN
jgi:hypothetical protein